MHRIASSEDRVRKRIVSGNTAFSSHRDIARG